jgi:hypothetical protein
MIFLYNFEKINFTPLKIIFIYNTHMYINTTYFQNIILSNITNNKIKYTYQLNNTIKKIIHDKYTCINNAFFYIDKNSNTLYIYLNNKNIIARINNNKNNYYITDKNEKIISNKLFTINTILADTDTNNTNTIYILSKLINNSKILKKYIIGIQQNKNNLYLISKINNHIIKLGTNNYLICKKIKNLENFYMQYLNKIIVNKYLIIDFQYYNYIIAIK